MTMKISKTIICVFLFVCMGVLPGTAEEAHRSEASPAGEAPLLGKRNGGRFFISADNVELFRIVEEIRAELGVTILVFEGAGDRRVSCSGEWEAPDAMVKGFLRSLGIRNYLLEFDGGKLVRVRVMNSKGRSAGHKGEKRPPESPPKGGVSTTEKQETFSFVKVQGVVEDSQADELDLMAGDYIVQYNGVEITGSKLLVSEVKKVSPESRVEMVVMRDHAPISFTLNGGMIGVRIVTVKLPGSDVF